MATIIIKNTGIIPVDIADLGISIPASSQRTLVEAQVGEFSIDEVDASKDLYDAINTSTLVVNDGIEDLSAADGIDHIRIDTDYEITERHYSKTELQSSGQSTIHWDNIINAPPIGSVVWQDPIECRIEEISISGPVTPVDGMFYINSVDNKLYKYVTDSWVEQTIIQNNRVVSKDDQYVYTWDGSIWNDSTAEISWAVVCTDDGDGKQSQYVYSSTNAWVKIADVDWGNHGSLLGLNNDDHTQYHNDTRGDARYYQQSQFYISSQGISTAILADTTGKIDISFLDIPELLTTFDHGDLSGLGDDDHTQYHNDIRGDLRYYQKTEFYNTSQASATGVWTDSAGKIDISFLPDGGIDTVVYNFSRSRANLNSMWLYTGEGVPSSVSGPRMPKNCKVVGISVQTSGTSTGTFYIRKNGVVTNLGNIALAGVSGNHNYSLDVDIDAGDFLSLYMDVTSGSISYPVVQVYCIWR